ncbi:hypothetical protein ACXIHB_01960 [Tenacibaculum sp. IMCC1]|uniref:Thymidylate kinase-like domain-containing protein n=1 Tax=Tenacibaculum sp. Pbs-1 TaxID=3238748 RepID=A0AB33L0U0_9FLAO
MKLAIVIEGHQNSGKTSTIKELINSYGNKSISQMKRGWQKLFLNSIFKYLKLDIYCVPASPSETNIELIKRFPNWVPEVLIVAVQPNGQHYSSSMSFLTNNNYQILKYSLTNNNGNLDWDRFDSSTKQNKLSNRADEIIFDIRSFINNNNLI